VTTCARRELVDPASVGLQVTVLPDCAVRRWRRSPGSVPTTTSAWSRAGTATRRPKVLDALARVFGLDDAGREYLLSLSTARSRARRPRKEAVPAGIRQLLDVIELPAFVESSLFDILAANRLATALDPTIRVGENRVRTVFLDVRFRELHPGWAKSIGAMVASLRASIGADPDQLADPRVVQLVGELSLESEEFRRLWARHNVKPLSGAPVRMDHPTAGPLELRREKLPIGNSGGQVLAILHAHPGSDSARALDLLHAGTHVDAATA
jgi:hypothetical protein